MTQIMSFVKKQNDTFIYHVMKYCDPEKRKYIC